MLRHNFIILLCFLMPLAAHPRRYSEIYGLSGAGLQGALMIEDLTNQNISDADKIQRKKDALALIKLATEMNDPAAAFLLGLIYFEESPRYTTFYDILFDEWSFYHYDPECGTPDVVTENPHADGLFDDPFDMTEFADVKTPLSYISYCIDNAIELFIFAAENGYIEAQCKLGQIYASKYKFNSVLAEKYYYDAAKHGSAEACAALGYEYFYGGNLFNYNFESAVKWLSKAVELGDYSHSTCLCLGYCYETGHGVTQDLKKAVEIYSQCSDEWQIADILGYSVSNFSIPFRLGILYYTNEYVRNYDKAFPYLKWIGEQKVREVGEERGYALRCLSACYRFGRGTAIDTEKADYYMKMAGEFGNIDAKQALKYLSTD